MGLTTRQLTSAGAAALVALLLGGCGNSTAADQEPLPPAYPADKAPAKHPAANAPDPGPADGPKVVSIDAFRKK